MWDKTVPNHKAQLIALATHLKDQMDAKKAARKTRPHKPESGSARPNLGKWLFNNIGPTLRGPDKKDYAWCAHHGRVTNGVHSGMYMPAPHIHDD